MRDRKFNYNRLVVGSIILTALFLGSCGDWTLPPELVGEWKTDETEVTVRTKIDKEWVFTSDTAIIVITINSDHSVSGSIGMASFENGVIIKNRGNPETTGCAQIIKCGSIGKIFPDDPMPAKEVQLWLAPMKENSIDTELRYTEGMNQFPMAGFLLIKVEEN